MVVERREAQRARSRRFAQAERSEARATPEAWAGGNIRPRGVAHDPAPPGAPLKNARGFSCEWLFVNLALAKLGRAGVARTRIYSPLPAARGERRRPSDAVLEVKNADPRDRLCERSERG